MQALRQAPAGHAMQVDDDFAWIELDHVPTGQNVGAADPVVQYEPAVHDRQVPIEVELEDEL